MLDDTVSNIQDLSLSSDSKNLILDKINKHRVLIAGGKNDNSTSVSNMQIVYWNDEMEYISRRYALKWPAVNVCLATDDFPKANAMDSVIYTDDNLLLNDWIEKALNHAFEISLPFVYASSFSNIGCTIGTYNNLTSTRMLFTCIGNNNNNILETYLKGEPCSNCYFNQVCSEKYNGLCEDKKIEGGLPGKGGKIDPISPPGRPGKDGSVGAPGIQGFSGKDSSAAYLNKFNPFWIIPLFVCAGVLSHYLCLYKALKNQNVCTQ